MVERDRLLDRAFSVPDISLSGEPTFNGLFNYLLDTNPLLRTRITDFRTSIETAGYDPREQELINRALVIATVGHQLNRQTAKRNRKEIDSTSGLPIPYVFHPLEMVEDMLSSRPGWLPDWVTLAAVLQHDLPEDVEFGPGLSTPSEWLEAIREEFADTGRQDLLVDLISGLLPTRELPQDEILREDLRKTPIYRMIRSYVEKGGVRRISGKDRGKRVIDSDLDEKILMVVHNLRSIFEMALRSPEHWRIFLLKIADIKHNLKSPKWIKEEKVLRGKIAASLAEWIGWYSARSDILAMLSEIIDINTPFIPERGLKQVLSTDERALSDLKAKADRFVKSLIPASMSSSEYALQAGWPNVCTGDASISGVGNKTTLPIPEILVTSGNEELLRKVAGGIVDRPAGWILPTIRRSMGRIREDKIAKIDGKTIIVRIESSRQPYIMDLLGKGFSLSEDAVKQVPEAGLFNGRLRGSTHWSYHLDNLIAFLYDPAISVHLGERKGLLIDQSQQPPHLYFFPIDYTFSEIYLILNKEESRGDKKLKVTAQYHFDDFASEFPDSETLIPKTKRGGMSYFLSRVAWVRRWEAVP